MSRVGRNARSRSPFPESGSRTERPFLRPKKPEKSRTVTFYGNRSRSERGTGRNKAFPFPFHPERDARSVLRSANSAENGTGRDWGRSNAIPNSTAERLAWVSSSYGSALDDNSLLQGEGSQFPQILTVNERKALIKEWQCRHTTARFTKQVCAACSESHIHTAPDFIWYSADKIDFTLLQNNDIPVDLLPTSYNLEAYDSA